MRFLLSSVLLTTSLLQPLLVARGHCLTHWEPEGPLEPTFQSLRDVAAPKAVPCLPSDPHSITWRLFQWGSDFLLVDNTNETQRSQGIGERPHHPRKEQETPLSHKKQTRVPEAIFPENPSSPWYGSHSVVPRACIWGRGEGVASSATLGPGTRAAPRFCPEATHARFRLTWLRVNRNVFNIGIFF